MADESEDDDEGTPEQKQLVELVSRVISHVTNGPLLLVHYEVRQQDKFARLWPKGGADQMQKRLDEVVRHLGGPPRLYILRHGENPPPEDGFPGAALQEILAVFERARVSILRAHMNVVGTGLVKSNPEFLPLPDDPKGNAILQKRWEEVFWEHAETAYIRLASYWDRVGQALNFAFFNIRSYKHESFQSVMDRIHDNLAKMDDKFAKRECWTRVRAFQCSSKDDGYKWLQERRNLLVHSLHLQPIAPDDDRNFGDEEKAENDAVFTSQFNHLDHAHREKLRPRDPAGEVSLLMGQLDEAAVLFADVLSLLEASPSRRRETF